MFQSYLIKPEPKLAQLYTVFTVFSIMPARDVPNCRKYFRKQIFNCGSPSYWIRYEISKCQNLENEWKYTEKKEVMLWSGGWSQLSVLSLTATENFQVVSFKGKANYFRCSSGKPDSVISCHKCEAFRKGWKCPVWVGKCWLPRRKWLGSESLPTLETDREGPLRRQTVA